MVPTKPATTADQRHTPMRSPSNRGDNAVTMKGLMKNTATASASGMVRTAEKKQNAAQVIRMLRTACVHGLAGKKIRLPCHQSANGTMSNVCKP